MLTNQNDPEKPIIAQIFKMWQTPRYIFCSVFLTLAAINGLMSAGIIVPNKRSINPLVSSTKTKSSSPANTATIQPPKSSPKPSSNLSPATPAVVPSTGPPTKKSGSANLATTISQKPSVKSTNGAPVSPKKSGSMKLRYTPLKDNDSTSGTRVR